MILHFEKILYEGQNEYTPLYSISNSIKDYSQLVDPNIRKEAIMDAIWNNIQSCTGDVYIKVVQE